MLSIPQIDTQILPNVISTFTLVLFFTGRLLVKKNLRLHIRFISLAMIIDVGLVLALVIFRNALGTVVGGDMSSMLKLHVAIAISTIIGYAYATFLGLKLVKGQRRYLRQMRTLDPILLSLRFLNTYTSWLLFI